MDLKERFPITVELDAIDRLSGVRVDSYLAARFPEISRTRWSRIIAAGVFEVDEVVLRPRSLLEEGQVVKVNEVADFAKVLDESRSESEKSRQAVHDEASLFGEAASGQKKGRYVFGVEPRILFEDEHLMVLDKPEGLTVHPGAGVGIEDTLVAWLIDNGKVQPSTATLSWGEQVLEQARPGIVHRLDRGTSGCLVVAKDPDTHTKLAKQFADKTAGRKYWAWVDGNATSLKETLHRRARTVLEDYPSKVAFRILKSGKHSVAAPIARDEKNRLRFAVSPLKGKEAITHFEILAHDKVAELEKKLPKVFETFGVTAGSFEDDNRYSVLDVELETGRTHQIRVHLAFLGIPIYGDGLYGGHGFERLLLHAHTLHLTHPHTGEAMSFRSVPST